MKIHTSMSITKNFKKVFRCGYCDLQFIMRACEPVYCNSGVYGWNNDMYVDFKRSIIVCTGYRNLKGTRIPDDLIEAFSYEAQEICCYHHGEDRVSLLQDLRKDFFHELDTLE